ncbi:MAG TPA: hypothetical protein ACFYD1_00345 [Candidatus Hypogeohydataceae bacterium YC38]
MNKNKKPKASKEEISLVPIIEEKEVALEQAITETTQKGEQAVKAAREEADKYLKQVREELPLAAKERWGAGLGQIEEEVKELVQAGQLEIKKQVEKAEGSIEEAKKAVLKMYLPELDTC